MVIEVVYYAAFEYCFESHDDLHDSISLSFLFRFVHWASSRLFRCLRLMSVFDLDGSKCYELILWFCLVTWSSPKELRASQDELVNRSELRCGYLKLWSVNQEVYRKVDHHCYSLSFLLFRALDKLCYQLSSETSFWPAFAQLAYHVSKQQLQLMSVWKTVADWDLQITQSDWASCRCWSVSRLRRRVAW